MKENNDTFLIIRIKKSLKKVLVELAGGDRKLSKYVRGILEKKIG